MAMAMMTDMIGEVSEMTLRDAMSDQMYMGCMVYDDYRGNEHDYLMYRGEPTELCEKRYGNVMAMQCVPFSENDSMCLMVLVREAADGDILESEYLHDKLHRFMRDMHGWSEGYSLEELFSR